MPVEIEASYFNQFWTSNVLKISVVSVPVVKKTPKFENYSPL